ncbi:hypothetical protein AMK19_05620 [Kitasatospora sp. CB01950]|nr:hypothetical protein AMK19_05620 [Kitasatospora sp. CB01950]
MIAESSWAARARMAEAMSIAAKSAGSGGLPAVHGGPLAGAVGVGGVLAQDVPVAQRAQVGGVVGAAFGGGTLWSQGRAGSAQIRRPTPASSLGACWPMTCRAFSSLSHYGSEFR